ncbi:uncharacterized protein SCHCODRAFT_02107197 [Schizophyllum commune H4-8]|uniref:uncharacterized protein n=1 Tax=Schizophyllum commune (strain H4-8 / FGSC 9210) TaxID=578458 RepID=UPI0021606918|nr:uncharacterized protein SCHCODRAFT_02107197 [Schizophyllum commune H4-8]KAI5885875.1 hypothetical protein SCHCODRAFT_02107197 [Schizophyllum commune H4-8]
MNTHASARSSIFSICTGHRPYTTHTRTDNRTSSAGRIWLVSRPLYRKPLDLHRPANSSASNGQAGILVGPELGLIRSIQCKKQEGSRRPRGPGLTSPFVRRLFVADQRDRRPWRPCTRSWISFVHSSWRPCRVSI